MKAVMIVGAGLVGMVFALDFIKSRTRIAHRQWRN